MKKTLIFLFLNFLFTNLIYSDSRLNNDKHFVQLVKNYNVQDIIEVEDDGKFFHDPLVKIVMSDGNTFCIKHAYSSNIKILMLYSLDDYDLRLVIENNGVIKSSMNGIPFNYLQLYFDFDIQKIEDIITHYDEIKAKINFLNSVVLYFKSKLTEGIYIKYSCSENEYPGRIKYENQLLRLEVMDVNRDRIKFEN